MNAPEKPVDPIDRQREFIKPGWYQDLGNDAYHASFGISSSKLKVLIEQTPAHLKHEFSVRKEPTAAMMLGTAVHAMVLEPDKIDDEIAVMPDLNLRTKLGREEKAEFMSDNAGKAIITPAQFEQAEKMAASVLDHPMANTLLSDIITESSVYWWYKSMDPDDDTEYKEMLKVRPDALCKGHAVVIDLKTTADGSYSGFIKAIQNFYYHVSAVMYLEGINQCKPLLEETGHFAYTNFVFICVENKAPYLASVYEIPAEYLEIGKTIYRNALYALKKGRENNWPGYPEDIRVIEPPGWARRGHIV